MNSATKTNCLNLIAELMRIEALRDAEFKKECAKNHKMNAAGGVSKSIFLLQTLKEALDKEENIGDWGFPFDKE